MSTRRTRDAGPLRVAAVLLAVASPACQPATQDAGPAVDAGPMGDVGRAVDAGPMGDVGRAVDTGPVIDVDRVVDAGPVPGAPRSGLTLAWSEPIGPTRSGTAHLTRLLLRGEWLYGANSTAGVTAWRIEPRGRLIFESSTEPAGVGEPMMGPSTLPRCVALTAHPSAPSLFCSAADDGVSRFDLQAPDLPAVRERQMLRSDDGVGRPAVHALDDALLIAAYDRGLLRAPLLASGAISDAAATVLQGDVVNVHGDGETLAALHRGRGLVSLRAMNGAVSVRGELALEGPPLGLRVRQRRAVVALGSAGVWLVDLSDDTPRVLRRVRPPCVATLGDVAGDALAVACSTGAWLYDLRTETPRVAGFDPATYGVLDVLLRDGARQLVVGDWRIVRVFDVDLAGHAVVPDVALGSMLRPGSDGVVVARNPGEIPMPLRLHRWVEDPKEGRRAVTVAEAVLAPGEVHRFTLPANDLQSWWDAAGSMVTLQVIPTTPGVALRERTGDVRLVRVAPEVPVQERAPADGEAFWSLRARPGTAWPQTLPMEGDREVAMLLPDCALQWGPLEDLAWRAVRSGAPAVVFAVDNGRALNDFERRAVITRFDAAPLGVWPFSDYFSPLPADRSTVALFESRLSASEVGGGDFTEVYRLRDGVVRSTERIYRGAFALR